MPSDKSHSSNLTIQELLDQFSSSSSRKRRGLTSSIEERYDELLQIELAGLHLFDAEGDNWSAGWILQVINRKKPDFLETLFNGKSSGWFKTPSSKGIDYGPLQKNLLEEKFEEADRLTTSFLRILAGDSAVERGYVYFSEIASIPSVDLNTLDRLWIAYSQGRFGFSIQAKILNSLNGRYEMLWPRIGWKKEGVWTRYPRSFDWTMSAPEGHMPLVNQLRGVRLMDEILKHPAISSRH